MSIHGLIVDDAPDVRRPLSAINSAHDQGWNFAVDSAANPVPPRRFIPDMVTAGSDGQRACRIVGDVGGRAAGMVHPGRRPPGGTPTRSPSRSCMAWSRRRWLCIWTGWTSVPGCCMGRPAPPGAGQGFSSAPLTARGPGRWSAAAPGVSMRGR